MGAAWEAFTACGDGPMSTPTVREIPELPTEEPMAGPHDWPDRELYNGIAGIVIHSYGDDPAGAFVKVYGPDRHAVEACLNRTVAMVESGVIGAIYEVGDR